MWLRGLLILALALPPAAGLLSDASAAHAPAVRSTALQLPRPMPKQRHAIKTVFLIVMENHNWSDIKGNPSAPYINHTLLPRASHAEQYYNPPGNHPSLPNYLWLEAGTNFGIGDDDDPSAHHLGTTHHLVSLLRRVGISWKAYQEGISGTDCPLTDSDPYATRHDPFVYFDDVTGGNNPRSAYCIAHVRPYPEMARDLRHNTVARYNFITPNVCDDMHDTCSPLNNSVQQGDTWLSRQVPLILNSQAYRRGGALFITWDEAGDGDGPIGMIVLSPMARGHGYASTIHYTHSSTLRTLQEIFGVKALLGDAAHATDLRNLFTTFP
jgi:phosphatidylinositol-3-phosphatase